MIAINTVLREELRTVDDADDYPQVPGEGPALGKGLGLAEGPARRSASRPASWTTLKEILGSRAPIVLVRLAADGDGVRAEATLELRAGTRNALEELCRFVATRFQRGRQDGKFTDEEWDQLLGREKARPTQRLALLLRLAAPGSEKVAVEGKSSATPNNIGQALYAGKLAALPDGTPFAIELLLGGTDQGRKSENPELARHPFRSLPDAIKLMAYRRALEKERQEGTVRDDLEFRRLLLDALNDVGAPIEEALFPEHVSRFREKLKKAGLEELALNAPQRRKKYAGVVR
jgi:hypothetical protein